MDPSYLPTTVILTTLTTRNSHSEGEFIDQNHESPVLTNPKQAPKFPRHSC